MLKANDQAGQNTQDLTAIHAAQFKAFHLERYPSYETRCDRLDRLADGLVNHRDTIFDAINEDFGGRSPLLIKSAEMMGPIQWSKNIKRSLKKWMKPEKHRLDFPFWLAGYKGEVQYQPKGVVGIVGPSNVPIGLCLFPLLDILGAGNRAMIKPSEFTPNSAAALQDMIRAQFDADEIAVVTGEADVSKAFSELPFDHLMFTGGARVARHIMRAAAENLTPLTLELGGKGPVFVSKTADLKRVAAKVMAGKLQNGGQVCVSPDYALVPADKVDELVALLQAEAKAMYPSFVDNPDYTGQVRRQEIPRLNALLSEANEHGARVVPLGDNSQLGESSKYMPSLVIDPADGINLTSNETFGPILSIKPYEELDEAIAYIQARDCPLVLYYFGSNDQELDSLLKHTRSGNVCINDVLLNPIMQNLPFGGIGESGMGRYYSQAGFKEFSNCRSVIRSGFFDTSQAMLAPPHPAWLTKAIDRMISKKSG